MAVINVTFSSKKEGGTATTKRCIGLASPVFEGLTYGQAMIIFELFVGPEQLAAPTIADKMGIPYRVVCDVLAGKTLPAAKAYWMARQ